jgi:hypothetical protein
MPFYFILAEKWTLTQELILILAAERRRKGRRAKAERGAISLVQAAQIPAGWHFRIHDGRCGARHFATAARGRGGQR